MFTWLEVPEPLDALRLRDAATQAGVAYVPGAPFYPGEGGEREMRLSFSALAEPDLAEAVRRLAGVVAAALPGVR
jgi:2-aminoadipate transaminase